MKNDEILSLEQIASWCAIHEALKQMYIIPKEEFSMKTTPMDLWHSVSGLNQNKSVNGIDK